MANNIILKLPKQASQIILNHVQRRYMPVNVPPTATGKRRFRLEVETDPHKLVNYCCGLNFHVDSPPVKLKPDNEYPDWLWNLRLGPKPMSWEMEKGTKEYYLQLAKEGVDRDYILRMTRDKAKKVTGKVLLSQAEYIHRLRFAALAHLEDDVGLEKSAILNDWWQNKPENQINRREYYLPVDEKKVLYKDKIAYATKFRRFERNEDSTFKNKIRVNPRSPITTPAILDSKRRYQHSPN